MSAERVAAAFCFTLLAIGIYRALVYGVVRIVESVLLPGADEE